jgi:hypothetical protein
VQCQKRKRDGNQCRARARSGRKYCALHSEPGKAAELGSKGGRRRAVYSPDGLKEFAAPKSAGDLRDLLAQSIIEIRAGKLDPKLANSISYLGAGFLRALEVADIEPRIEELERELDTARQLAATDKPLVSEQPQPGEVYKRLADRTI